MIAFHTIRVTEVEEMAAERDLKHEYASSQTWTVMKMIRSYESDQSLAYIHGFDAGIDLLCAKAKSSNPAMADDIRELANKMAEETAERLRLILGKKSITVISLFLAGK